MSYVYRYIHQLQFGDIDTNKLFKDVKKDDVLILDAAWESISPFTDWKNNYYQLIADAKKITDKIFIVANNDFLKKDLHISGVIDVLIINYFLYRAYKKIVIEKQSNYNKKWNVDNNCFLFLGGREKLHRAKFLLNLLKKDLLKSCFYSLPWHKNSCLEESWWKEEYNIILKHTKFIDSFKINNGMVYNDKWYTNSLFQIVNESNFGKSFSPFISEKTWLSIINHQPFLMLGNAYLLDKLENYGFNTFARYLKYPNYNNAEDAEEYIELLIENIIYWLTYIKKFSKDINNDIEENFLTITGKFNETKNKIITFCKINELNTNIDNIVNTDYNWSNITWDIFYNNIKDPLWPPSFLIKDFNSLPTEIKHDCRNDSAFGDILLHLQSNAIAYQ